MIPTRARLSRTRASRSGKASGMAHQDGGGGVRSMIAKLVKDSLGHVVPGGSESGSQAENRRQDSTNGNAEVLGRGNGARRFGHAAAQRRVVRQPAEGVGQGRHVAARVDQ